MTLQDMFTWTNFQSNKEGTGPAGFLSVNKSPGDLSPINLLLKKKPPRRRLYAYKTYQNNQNDIFSNLTLK